MGKLQQMRGFLGESVYQARYKELLSLRQALEEQWGTLKEQCGEELIDISTLDGSQPPAPILPETPEQSAKADAQAQSAAADQAERERLDAVDPPIEKDPLGNALIDALAGGIVGALGKLAQSALKGAASGLSKGGAAGLGDEAGSAIARALESTADDATRWWTTSPFLKDGKIPKPAESGLWPSKPAYSKWSHETWGGSAEDARAAAKSLTPEAARAIDPKLAQYGRDLHAWVYSQNPKNAAALERARYAEAVLRLQGARP